MFLGEESLEALEALNISFNICGSIPFSSAWNFVFIALFAEKTLLALALLGSSTSPLFGLSASESDSDSCACSPTSGPSTFLAFFFLFLFFFFFFSISFPAFACSGSVGGVWSLFLHHSSR